jgi:hypothetical protein
MLVQLMNIPQLHLILSKLYSHECLYAALYKNAFDMQLKLTV